MPGIGDLHDDVGPPQLVALAPWTNHPDIPVEVLQRSDLEARREGVRHELVGIGRRPAPPGGRTGL